MNATVLADARATTHRVARTFSLACRLLPPAVRDDVYLLYLVFRTIDDLVDDGRPEAAERVAGLHAWATGEPADTPETRILAVLDARYALDREPFAEFSAGMWQDLAGERFATEADVDRYCHRVAGTVGLVMAEVLGTRDPARARPAAAALGMAMQRTNILRDIDEDAANGRVYIAEETLARHGSLAPGRRSALVREQIALADALYDRGLAGLRELRRGRRAVAAAGTMYRELLRELEREGYGARPGRAVVPGHRKLRVAARGALCA